MRLLSNKQQNSWSVDRKVFYITSNNLVNHKEELRRKYATLPSELKVKDLRSIQNPKLMDSVILFTYDHITS